MAVIRHFRSRGNRAEAIDSRVLDTGRRIADVDCMALRQAVADLACGNIPSGLRIEPRVLDPEGFPEARQWVDLMNSISVTLSSTASEFNTMTETPCRRLCYIGADSFLEGEMCGEAMGRALDGRGEVAVVTSPGVVSLELRRKGFETRLREKYPGVILLKPVHVGGSASAIGEHVTMETDRVIRTHGSLSGLYVTKGGIPSYCARAVEQAGATGRIRIVAHDLVESTMHYLAQGVITATLNQDPFAQGHDPVIHMFNHVAVGWQPPSPRLLTRLEVVTQANYREYWEPGIGLKLLSNDRYARPIDRPSPRTLRFLFLGRADNPFFDAVSGGVQAAAEELRSLNAVVELVIPEQNRRDGDISAAAYLPYVETAAAKRYDGLIVGIFDSKLIPAINQTFQSGVPVITYNSEPGGLRTLIYSNIEQANKLLDLSQQMAQAMNHVRSATVQINVAMGQVSQGTVAQNDHVSRTHEALAALLRHIDEVSSEARKGASEGEAAGVSIRAGAQALEMTLHSTKAIRDSVGDTARTVERLGEHSKRIDVIIKIISGIASQIKLLGLNAAIEAAHAGSYGAGFLVVAAEIRSLADRTAKATREITELVGTVQSCVVEVEKAMATGLEKVSHSAKVAGEATAVLEQIRTSIATNQQRLETIVASIDQMQTFSRAVGDSMESVAAISEENAASVEEVSASTEEMLSHLEKANQMAQDLSEIAQGEQQLLAKFRSSEGF